MTRLTILMIFIVAVTARGQETYDRLFGAYKAKGDGFEKYSILVLQTDKRFIYEYVVRGCRGEVKGTWIVKGKELILTNDKEFPQNEIVVNPDMSLTRWTIRKRGIKPNDIVDCGCVKETRIHLRMRMK